MAILCTSASVFRATNDGQSLEVKSVSYEHNHDVNKVYIHSCTILAPNLQIAANVDQMSQTNYLTDDGH